MNENYEVEKLRVIIQECIILAQEVNDLLDVNKFKATLKVEQLINILQLGVPTKWVHFLI